MSASFVPDDDERASVQAAIEAFLAANSEDEMRDVVADYPFVVDPPFNAILEQMIDHAARAGQPEAMFHLQAQIATLETVLRQDAASPAESAVDAFLYAQDEAEATSIFAESGDLLRTDEATHLLFSLEAGDPEGHLHLEARRQLWRRLVGANG